MTWPDQRITELFGIEHPILLAPMAGPCSTDLAIAVANAGGLGALPCAMLSPDQIRADLLTIRARTKRPLNVNFFVHRMPDADPAAEQRWKSRLAGYYTELGIDPDAPVKALSRAPFDDVACTIVEELKPEVVSFHFGLPEPSLLARVDATGAKIIGSATTAAEARWLAERGCAAIIAQGAEAGGHRGMFLTSDVATQVGTFALVPQIVDAVTVPVIAAGGISDGRGIAAAFALGAAGVQVGTAYLFCPEARVSPLHREALKWSRDDATAMTNLFTGRPARGIVNRLMREVGPMSPDAPPFPTAIPGLAPLRAASEAKGSSDFTSLWSGQAAALSVEMPAADLTRKLADDALAHLKRLAG